MEMSRSLRYACNPLAFVIAGVMALTLPLIFSNCAQDNPLGESNPILKIDSIAPNTGYAGTKVHIFGQGFSGNISENKVALNGENLQISQPSSLRVLVVTIPKNAQSGNIAIQVGTQKFTGPLFTVVTTPTITRVLPTQGFAGTEVKISGNRLNEIQAVKFNSVNATVKSKTDSLLVVSAPQSTTGSIVLSYANGTVTGPVFSYLQSPVITNLSPSSGFAGNTVTITGARLNLVSQVKFKGVETAIISKSETQIVVKAPQSSTGVVSLHYDGGTVTGPTFTYLQPPAATSLTPTQGYAGTEVTINGTQLGLVTKISFNGAEAGTFTSQSDTQIKVIAPASTTGAVSLYYSEGTVTGPIFTYLQAPAITTINPTQGLAGDPIVINGSNLTQVSAVKFNNVTAAIQSKTNTQIIVTAPQSSTGEITLSYPNGTITGPVFTYLQVPIITNVAYENAGNDNYIRISGQHFSSNITSLKVYINNVITPIRSAEGSSLTIDYPPANTNNPASIIVESNGVKSTSYAFTFKPVIAGQTNQIVGYDGNYPIYRVTISGSYFGQSQQGKSVYFQKVGSTTVQAATVVTWSPTEVVVDITLLIDQNVNYFEYWIAIGSIVSDKSLLIL